MGAPGGAGFDSQPPRVIYFATPPACEAAGPARQVVRGTRSLVGPARGTHYQGRLVGLSCQIGWWDCAVRLKFTNLNGHIDMTRRRIVEVSA
jgi:hypothetical protein